MRLASMEVSSESTENDREFWIQWNSMMLEIKGSENKFNLSTSMVDQNVGSINSIAVVYGEEGRVKTKTCP